MYIVVFGLIYFVIVSIVVIFTQVTILDVFMMYAAFMITLFILLAAIYIVDKK